jgi:hypothetical protein
MVLQFFTKQRPNLDVPFWEDSEEGKARADAISQLANDHPELCLGRDTMPSPAVDLTWTATRTFPDVAEFRQFLSLAYTLDPDLRADRARYYMKHGHTLHIEYQGEGMEERVTTVHISSDGIRRPDGAWADFR